MNLNVSERWQFHQSRCELAVVCFEKKKKKKKKKRNTISCTITLLGACYAQIAQLFPLLLWSISVPPSYDGQTEKNNNKKKYTKVQ